MELTTRDGRIASRRVDWPKGYPQNPVSPADLERKFRDLAATAVDAATADRIVEAVAGLERAARVDDLLALVAHTAESVRDPESTPTGENAQHHSSTFCGAMPRYCDHRL